jgi:hypothetical protein
LNGEEMRRVERDMRLLTVVAEDLLPVEDGEEERGDVEGVRWKVLGGEFIIDMLAAD